MPTSRAYSFLGAAFVLYLFANQTQVGWLYVMSALLAGTVLAGFWLGRGSLRGIEGQRKLGESVADELYESDELTIELTLRRKARTGTSHVRTVEVCPLAAPDDPRRTTALFIPSIPANDAVQFDYTITLDRRGLHEFPPLALESGAPFGFFRRKRTLAVSTRTLVYPEVRPLRRLDLLDRQLTPQITNPRAGVGTEIMGVRPFRSGDSPRHIHWRSVARTGQLISKEFADETQPGLSLILDLFKHPYPQAETKHTPFEWAVKAAASIGDYAQRKGYPLHFVVDQDVLAAPVGAVTRMALLQYLARVQPTGTRNLAQIIGPTQAFAAVILPWPDQSMIEPLVELRRTRIEVLAVVVDPKTFPDGGEDAAPLADQLRAAGIDTRLLQFDQTACDWAVQLAEATTHERIRV
jgi:uncharacterized protein (DUF58 family)